MLHQTFDLLKFLYQCCNFHFAVICCVAIVAAQDTYTVGVIEQAPLVIRGRNDSSTPTGFIPDLLEEIATKLDIQFTYLWVDTYGGKNADGSWTGLVQKVMDGVRDCKKFRVIYWHVHVYQM